MDCYGDPKVTGKVGTDIEESKCGWLVIQALKKCNEEQRKVLEVRIIIFKFYKIYLHVLINLLTNFLIVSN